MKRTSGISVRALVVHQFDIIAALFAGIVGTLLLAAAIDHSPPEEKPWKEVAGGFAGHQLCWATTGEVWCAYEPPDEVSP